MSPLFDAVKQKSMIFKYEMKNHAFFQARLQWEVFGTECYVYVKTINESIMIIRNGN